MVSGSDHGQYAQTGQQGNLQPKVMVILKNYSSSIEANYICQVAIFLNLLSQIYSECSLFYYIFWKDFQTNSLGILMLKDLSE